MIIIIGEDVDKILNEAHIRKYPHLMEKENIRGRLWNQEEVCLKSGHSEFWILTIISIRALYVMVI